MFKENFPQNNLTLNNTRDAYLLNQFYEKFIFQKSFFSYQIDSWKDKLHYGLINKSGDSIYPKNVSFASYNNDNSVTQQNLFFVVEAFKELKNYHRSFLVNNKFERNSSIYVSLNPISSAVNFDSSYIQYVNELYRVFVDTFLNFSSIKKIYSINDFMKYFIFFIKAIANISPFNRSSFITFRKCDPDINGLNISFADENSFDDVKRKANDFFNDSNFYGFADSCKRFGFIIDRNIPWKITADLESPVMVEYYKKFGLQTSDDVINKLYHVAYEADIESLTNILISFWNLFVDENPINTTAIDLPECGAIKLGFSVNKKVNKEIFDKLFNINWKLRFYILTKIYEFNLNVTQNKFDSLYHECIKLNNYYGLNNALQKINDDLKVLKSLSAPQNLSLTQEDFIARITAETSFNRISAINLNF